MPGWLAGMVVFTEQSQFGPFLRNRPNSREHRVQRCGELRNRTNSAGWQACEFVYLRNRANSRSSPIWRRRNCRTERIPHAGWGAVSSTSAESLTSGEPDASVISCICLDSGEIQIEEFWDWSRFRGLITPHANFRLAAPGTRDVERRLHARVHLYAEPLRRTPSRFEEPYRRTGRL